MEFLVVFTLIHLLSNARLSLSTMAFVRWPPLVWWAWFVEIAMRMDRSNPNRTYLFICFWGI